VNIFVLIKQVPDTEASIRISPDNKSIPTADLNLVMNPYDEFAVEEALKIKEKFGGEVTAICLGDEGAIKSIRTALAMGVDKAIHVIAPSPWDAGVIAKTLAGVVKDRPCDILLCGKQAVDYDNAQVGPMIAEYLGWSNISVVSKLQVSLEKVVAERAVEGGVEVVESPLPVVITAQKGLNEPRYASLKGIMMAKKKPVDAVNVGVLTDRIEILKLEYPPNRKGGVILGEGVDAVPALIRVLKEEAKIL
jgi:electron transfer flavoprotein beta subunit